MTQEEVKNTDKWKMENWLISHAASVFCISDVLFIHRPSETSVTLGFMGGQISYTFPSKEAADNNFNWLSECKKSYNDAKIDINAKRAALTSAQVEIQNRLAGHVVGSGCHD